MRGTVATRKITGATDREYIKTKGKEALLGILWNRDYALTWTWEELGTIGDDVKRQHHITLEFSHRMLKDCVF